MRCHAGDRLLFCRAMEGPLSQVLKLLRVSRGLTQREFATAVGLSVDTVRSYESGRRIPGHDTVAAIAESLGASRAERRELFGAAGDDVRSSPQLDVIRMRRPRAEGIEAELAHYEWPCLVVNERHELLAWNNLANAVAEAALAELLPTQSERSLLWMASLDHFQERLDNWDELIGRLVSTFRLEGVALDRGSPPPPYLQALIARLAAEREQTLNRFSRLWFQPDQWREGMRNLHPIRWRLADGTELCFTGAFRDWSIFDGSFVFDWTPGDSTTSDWVARALAVVGHGAVAPGIRDAFNGPFAKALSEARKAVGLSRVALAESAGVSADALYAYERGIRRPRRDTLLRIATALSVDGYTANQWLRSLGYAEEPSDFARAVLGLEARGVMKGHLAVHGVSEQQRLAELQSTPWPCFMVNAMCEVEDANDAARRLVGLDAIPPPGANARVHLLDFMFSPICRSRLKNWAEVAGAILPSALRPFVMGYAGDKPDTALADRIKAFRRRDPAALRELAEAWDLAAERPVQHRIAVPVEWGGESGALMRYQCFVSPWNGFDPYWGVDWHPANAAAWGAVG